MVILYLLTPKDRIVPTSRTRSIIDIVKAFAIEKKVFYSRDHQAKWIKKRGKVIYGYKGPVGVDSQHGFVLGGHMTSANVSDMNQLREVLIESDVNEGDGVLADKGYASSENRNIVEKEFQCKDLIMKKAVRNRKLTDEEKTWDKQISKVRYKIERTFGSLKKHLGFDRLRYLGKQKAQMEFFFSEHVS